MSAAVAWGLTAQSHRLAVAPDGAVTIAWVETFGWSGPPGEANAVRIAPDGTVGASTLLSPAGTVVDRLRLATASRPTGAPKHTYQRAGTFLVRVTVTDNAGNSATKSHVIVVT